MNSGISIVSDFSFSLPDSISVATFEALAELDSLVTSKNIVSDTFTSGITISDTPENVKGLIKNTSTNILAAKDNISNILISGAENNLVTITWEEYLTSLGAASGTTFNINDSTTYATSATALKNLTPDFNLIVVGSAAEIKHIISAYGESLNNLPPALTFQITDGGALSLTQAQLDKLDAKIDGVVQVSDTSTGIATLLNKAIPTTVESITSTNTLKITFDQFRNLPNYYSGDVVLVDTEDEIVNALKEDLLDDRVTTLVITQQSTTLGKATTSGGSTSTSDSSLTVTAAAAANILSKKIYSSTNYDSENFDANAYLDINIVDRGAAIASFIGSATIPGASTAANETGKINFTEKDGGTIILDYNQNLAYQALISADAFNEVSTGVPSSLQPHH